MAVTELSKWFEVLSKWAVAENQSGKNIIGNILYVPVRGKDNGD